MHIVLFQWHYQGHVLISFSKVDNNNIPVLIEGIPYKPMSCLNGIIFLHHYLQKVAHAFRFNFSSYEKLQKLVQ